MTSRIATMKITEGAEYLYTADSPAGCKGCRYRVLKLVVAEPVKQRLVCVEALEGPDAGIWFVCSPHNFSTRYVPVPVVEVAPVEDRSAGVPPENRGTGV